MFVTWATFGVCGEPDPQPVAVIGVLFGQRLSGTQRRPPDTAPIGAVAGGATPRLSEPISTFSSGSVITEGGALASNRTPIWTPSPARRLRRQPGAMPHPQCQPEDCVATAVMPPAMASNVRLLARELRRCRHRGAVATRAAARLTQFICLASRPNRCG